MMHTNSIVKTIIFLTTLLSQVYFSTTPPTHRIIQLKRYDNAIFKYYTFIHPSSLIKFLINWRFTIEKLNFFTHQTLMIYNSTNTCVDIMFDGLLRFVCSKYPKYAIFSIFYHFCRDVRMKEIETMLSETTDFKRKSFFWNFFCRKKIFFV